MYIDSVSGTLQSLNDTAGNLNRIKAQYEEDQLKRAELLNRMGQNENAEKALWDANHSGLLTRYLPNRSKGWEVDGAFAPVTDKEQKELADLNSLSGNAERGQLSYDEYKNNFLKSLNGKDGYVPSENDWEYDTSVSYRQPDGSLDFMPSKIKEDVVKKQYAKDQETYKKEKAANDLIEKENAKKREENSSLPVFSRAYKGDETDQLTQLNNDATKAIKYYLNKGDTTSAMLAYDTYVTTGNSIAQRYQHQFKAIDAKSLFPKDKGGGGTWKGKMVDYSYGTGGIGGKGTLIQLPEYTLGDEEAQMKYIQKHYKKLWDKEPNGRLSAKVGTEGTEFQTPEDRARTEALELKTDREAQLDADVAYKATYDGIDIHKSDKERVDEANNNLGPNSKYMFIINQWGGVNKVERAGYRDNRNVVRSTGTGNNAVDNAIGD